ncbi:MAG: protease modulator HflC [Gammaproteobacteria bacterium]|nr:protease modulator HflC [Gammaproteobacteria bacterium]
MKLMTSIVALLVVAVVVSMSVFTVREDQTAVKVRLGQIRASDYKPGLHFKLPIVEDIYKIEGRVMTVDTPPQRVLTIEKKNVMVDLFVKWRVSNAEKFYLQASASEQRAADLIEPVVRKALLDAFGKRTVDQVVAQDRTALLDEIEANAAGRAADLGVELVDVRVKKVEWPSDVLSSVYERMRKERATVAAKFRSEGDEAARGIRASSDREREELIAEALSESQKTRGEGDALAARIYAEAYSVDPEFYSFYRTTNAYGKVFNAQNDMMVIDTESDFFKYFGQSNAR